MTTIEIIGQLIGFLGTGISLLSFQCKKRNGILAYQVLGAFCFTVHFLMLGKFSGAAMNAISMIRAAIFFFRGQRKWADSILWLPGFVVLSVAACILTWESPFSLLPMTGMVLTTFAQCSSSAKMVRLLTLPNNPCWLVYNFVSGSVAGVVTEILMICSIIIGFLRHDVRRRSASDTADRS